MHKFFTEQVTFKDGKGTAVIVGDDVKHIWKVLRLKEKDSVLINDLNGQDYSGEILSVSKEEVRVKLNSMITDTSESPLEITVFQGIPKGQKMDLISQKLSELGVSKIVQVRMERTIPENENENKKLDRYRRIILEGCKQSKRSRITSVTPPMDLNEASKLINELDLLIVPYENEENRGIKSIEGKISEAKKIGILVGPEGGISEDEIKILEDFGGEVITLGPRILRTETCAITVVSILQYIAGDMG
ncbi:MAG: RsmE family RNA methyltransferase [Clostridiaceae bacterium]